MKTGFPIKRWLHPSGRMVVTFVACAAVCLLAAASSLEGTTFSWLYSAASGLEPEDVSTAFVSLEYEGGNESWNLEFEEMGEESRDVLAQFIALETALSLPDNTQAERNQAFRDWWENGYDAEKCFESPSGLRLGGVYCKKYSFKNTSVSPAYFRIAAPETGGGLTPAFVVWYLDAEAAERSEDWEFVNQKDFLLTEHEGYYYCPKLLDAEEDISVMVAAYLPHRANAGYGRDALSFDMAVERAELIQAVNDTVHFIEGWRDIEEHPDFRFMPHADLVEGD